MTHKCLHVRIRVKTFVSVCKRRYLHSLVYVPVKSFVSWMWTKHLGLADDFPNVKEECFIAENTGELVPCLLRTIRAELLLTVSCLMTCRI